MQFYKGTNIYFRYEEQIEYVLEDISFSCSSENRIGLIGKNGCGKSTLFNILLGKNPLNKGELYFCKDINIGYLPQEVDMQLITSSLPEKGLVKDYLWMAKPILYEIKKKINKIEDFNNIENLKILSDFQENDGYSFEYNFERILSKFKIEKEILDRSLSSISGGEKTKIALCQIILKDPDILLLDEPTNHLDHETLIWLEKFLNNISIPYIVISHDRKFLDNCVNCIWEIYNKKLNVFSGNYNFYEREKEIEYDNEMKKYLSVNKKIKNLEIALRKRKEKAMKFENFKLKRSKKKKGGFCKRDDGSGSKKLRTKKMMRSAKALETRINKVIEKEKVNRPEIDKKRKILFESTTLKNRFILKIENLGKSFGNINVFNNINFSIRNNSRVAILGQNGSGKTTLLKILTGKISSYEGSFKWSPQTKIGYYSQEHEYLNLNNSILDEITQKREMEYQFARIILGCFNIKGDKVFKKIENLSVGEKSKVSLAKTIISKSNVLVLDEPVNHLEISARVALEKALLNYKGTIIFVTHDRYLIEKLATEIFDMSKLNI